MSTGACGLQVVSCRICAAGATPGYSMCTSCRDVALALQRPPVLVTPIALVTEESPLYRALRQYKSGEHDVAARQAARLTALVDRYFARHGTCVAPNGLDAVVVVPSPRDGRPPPHPLAAVVAATTTLPPLVDALAPGGLSIAHRRPSVQGYRIADDIAGARLLLVDDVCTSGAHVQSAAATLIDAGASDVRAVVLGRFVRHRAPRLTCVRCRR